jgi:hypothetical protein
MQTKFNISLQRILTNKLYLTKSEMDFTIQTEKITTNIIENFVNILLNMKTLVWVNKCLLQILLNKMHEVFTHFQVKFNMSFSQMLCILWMMVCIKKIFQYRPDLCCMSPFSASSSPSSSSSISPCRSRCFLI